METDPVPNLDAVTVAVAVLDLRRKALAELQSLLAAGDHHGASHAVAQLPSWQVPPIVHTAIRALQTAERARAARVTS